MANGVLFRAAVSALLLVAPGSLAAQAPALPRSDPAEAIAAAAEDQFRALGSWVQQINAALEPMNQALVRFSDKARKLPPPDRDRARFATEHREFREAIAQVRLAIQGSRLRLEAIARFDRAIPGLENIDPNRLLADAKEQTERLSAYMDDADGFAAAAMAGKRAAAEASVRKMLQGGYLLMETQVMLARGRQALFPPNRPAHQLTGVPVQLYRAMSMAYKAWYKASVERDGKTAARMQVARFREIDGELDILLRAGRSNLAAEMGKLRLGKSDSASNPAMLRVIAKAEAMAGSYEKLFVLGDEIRAWVRAKADSTGTILAAEANPALVSELSVFEMKLVAYGSEVAAILAR